MDPADTVNEGDRPAGGVPTPPAPMPPINLPPPPRSAQLSKGAGAPLGAPDSPAVADLGSAVVDDGDLIEKEWVNRVRQVITANRNDPYKQSEQLAALRAEYMKKRYGKDIKLGK